MQQQTGIDVFAHRVIAAALPACALVVAMAANAAPRGETAPPEPQTPESREARRLQMATEMATWLPRMVGQFTIDGVVEFTQTRAAGAGPPPEEEMPQEEPLQNVRPVSGKADCIAIGAGAGVQCVIHAIWEEEWQSNGLPVEGGVSSIGPAAILYGFDPNASVVRYLLLNTNGIAETRTGTLEGNTLRFYFEYRCESNPDPADNPNQLCRRVTGLYIPPAAKHVTMTIDLESWSVGLGRWNDPLTRISVDMRRVAGNEANQASPSPQ